MKNLYAMNDQAISYDIGQAIEAQRLICNISQQAVADELGVTRNTYKKLVVGKAKLETVIGVLRCLDSLDLIHSLMNQPAHLPFALEEFNAKVRQRASKAVH